METGLDSNPESVSVTGEMNASTEQVHSAGERRGYSPEVAEQLKHHPSRKPPQTPALDPPKPSLCPLPSVCVEICVLHQTGAL